MEPDDDDFDTRRRNSQHVKGELKDLYRQKTAPTSTSSTLAYYPLTARLGIHYARQFEHPIMSRPLASCWHHFHVPLATRHLVLRH